MASFCHPSQSLRIFEPDTINMEDTTKNNRHKRANRLVAEKKLRDQSPNNGSSEESSDFDSNIQAESDFGEDDDEMDNDVDVELELKNTSNYTCKECGRKFITKGHLRRHEMNQNQHKQLRKRAVELGKSVFSMARDWKSK